MKLKSFFGSSYMGDRDFVAVFVNLLPGGIDPGSVTLKRGPEVITKRSLGTKNGSIESSTVNALLLSLNLPTVAEVVSIYKSIARFEDDFMRSLFCGGCSFSFLSR